MELLTAPSKTDQVAAILRGMIKKGKYIPNSRLAGVRELAKQFQVSSCVVSCALETLQKEHLIRCEHGRGIFVEQWAEDGMIDVYLLLWGMKNESNNFFTEFMKMTYPPILQENFSFNIRTVMRESEEARHLDMELARIDSTPNIKCVLVNANPFNRIQMEKFQQLHSPVIFFGDSGQESLSDFACNNITGDNRKHGMHCAEFMINQGHREITLLTFNRKAYFYDLFCKGVEDAARQAGIKLNMYEFPFGVHDYGDINSDFNAYEKVFAMAEADGMLDKPLLLNALKPEFFPLSPSAKKRLTKTIPVMFPVIEGSLLTEFYSSIFKMIKTVVKNPLEFRHELIDIPFRIIDLTNNESFLVNHNHSPTRSQE